MKPRPAGSWCSSSGTTDSYVPFEAMDGQQAIDQLDAAAFDVLVLDLMMRHADSFGVLDHIIETQPRMVEKTL
jgi:CheY-like chemotaxis protein